MLDSDHASAQARAQDGCPHPKSCQELLNMHCYISSLVCTSSLPPETYRNDLHKWPVPICYKGNVCQPASSVMAESLLARETLATV